MVLDLPYFDSFVLAFFALRHIVVSFVLDGPELELVDHRREQHLAAHDIEAAELVVDELLELHSGDVDNLAVVRYIVAVVGLDDNSVEHHLDGELDNEPKTKRNEYKSF